VGESIEFIQEIMDEEESNNDDVDEDDDASLVKYMLELDPRYRDYVVYENGKRVIYVVVLRASYGMLVARLLFYKKLRADLEGIGFEFNAYDPALPIVMLTISNIRSDFMLTTSCRAMSIKKSMMIFMSGPNRYVGPTRT